MNLKDFVINALCKTGDFTKKSFLQRTVRHREPATQMADIEISACEIVGEMLGFDTDRDIFGFFRDVYGHYFLMCSTRVSFVPHITDLWIVKERLFGHLARRFKDVVGLMDSRPL